MKQLTIKELSKPKDKNLKEDVAWLCNSMGFSAGRDIEKVCPTIVSQILKRMAEKKPVTVELLADDLETSPAKINHHVRHLINAGFIIRERKHLFLRGGSVKEAITEIRNDLNRVISKVELIAEDMDNSLKIKNREE